MTGQKPLLAIIGPTASGKSALAMAVGAKCGGEILSIDSMQIYKGMDIGTAKPTESERREIRHHLIDVARPDELSARRDLWNWRMRWSRRGKCPLVATGGTPMYFKALFEGLFEGPGADESLRNRLKALSGAELHERLKQVDAAAAERIHAGDSKRLVRALEVFELTGKPISVLQKQWESNQSARIPAVWIGLMWERDELNRRINCAREGNDRGGLGGGGARVAGEISGTVEDGRGGDRVCRAYRIRQRADRIGRSRGTDQDRDAAIGPAANEMVPEIQECSVAGWARAGGTERGASNSALGTIAFPAECDPET